MKDALTTFIEYYGKPGELYKEDKWLKNLALYSLGWTEGWDECEEKQLHPETEQATNKPGQCDKRVGAPC
jgi:hypothetical protein